VSFAADLQQYLIYTAVPFKALRLGADPFDLGVLAAASTGVYAVLVALFGRWSDRVPRIRLARGACAGVIGVCIGLTLAQSVRRLVLCVAMLGASMALFWPSVQAAIADRSRLGELEKHLGRFNLSWSIGKAGGFLIGGLLVSTLGPAGTFTVASLIAFTIFWLLPGRKRSPSPIDALLERQVERGPDAERRPQAAPYAAEMTSVPLADAVMPAVAVATEEPELDPRAPLFRRLAWAAIGSAYGLAATLTYHYPRLVEAHGWTPRLFGLFMGIVYLTQAVTFAVLMVRPQLWRFRRARLYGPQLAMLLAMASLPFADLGRLAVASMLFGIGVGVCYCASIYYSLHTHEQRGRNAGVHEMLIGLGGMSVPLLGGALARHFGALWVPYATAAAAVGLSLIVQELMYRVGKPAGGKVSSLLSCTSADPDGARR
jgi:MFS family permease